jgi:hypothetical protein
LAAPGTVQIGYNYVSDIYALKNHKNMHVKFPKYAINALKTPKYALRAHSNNFDTSLDF